MYSMFVTLETSQLEISSLNELIDEQYLEKRCDMSVTSEVFQDDISPYMAAAPVWSWHHLFTLNCIVVVQG